MVIRETQLQPFQGPADERFTGRMCDYVRDSFPPESKRLGPGGLRSFVRQGIARARGWGFFRECDIAGFLAIMLLLSPTFDNDPRVQWAKDILRSPADAPTRMERLWVATKRMLQQLASDKS